MAVRNLVIGQMGKAEWGMGNIQASRARQEAEAEFSISDLRFQISDFRLGSRIIISIFIGDLHDKLPSRFQGWRHEGCEGGGCARAAFVGAGFSLGSLV